MKLKLSEKFGIFNKIYGLYFSQWGDLWPYSNAYVRPETRAMRYWRLWKGKELGMNHIAAFISCDRNFRNASEMHLKFSELFRNASQMHQKCFPTENNTNEPKNSIFLQNKAIIPPETQEISSINGQKFTSLKKTPKKPSNS